MVSQLRGAKKIRLERNAAGRWIWGFKPTDIVPEVAREVVEWCGFHDADDYLAALSRKRRAIFPKEGT